MIGPGWMPSRPRPLAKVRFYARRPRTRRPRPAPNSPRIERFPCGKSRGCAPDFLRFEGTPAELPVATLRPGASQAWHRVVAGDLQRWLGDRWAWLQPRSVPLLVAFAGFLAVLGATKYLSVYACSNDLMSRAPVEVTDVPASDGATRAPAMRRFAAPPLSRSECDALVQTLPDSWPGRERHLQLHGDLVSFVEVTLDRSDACSLAPVRLR